MTRQEAIRRMCALQSMVSDAITGHEEPADCFCGDGGFWGCAGYGEARYQNEGQAIEWIERVVQEAIERAADTEET